MFLVRLGSNAAGFVLCARILLGAKGPPAAVAAPQEAHAWPLLKPRDGTPENSETTLVGSDGTPGWGSAAPALEMPMESRRLVVR